MDNTPLRPRFIPLDLLFALLLLALSGHALAGAAGVPFHPDESTQLFMSADFEALAHPEEMAWSHQPQDPLRQHYRLIDAPLTRYLIGLSRSFAGLEALPIDWDWAESWETNRQAGALPTPDLLQAGRRAVTLLLPLSLLFIYIVGRKIGHPLAGLIAAGLLGTNALTLLHARRAMAEGPLLFGVTLFLCSLPGAGRRPWLTGLAAALAFNAKQSALALLPIGLLAAAWLPEDLPRGKAQAARSSLLYLTVFCLVTAALNPVWWRSPVPALRASLAERQDLLERQTSDARRFNPGQYLDSTPERAVALLANLYLTPPAFAELGNYQAQTAGAKAAYLQWPVHSAWRSMAGGGLLLFLTLAGLVLALMRLRRADPSTRRSLSLLLIASGSPVVFQLAAVPLSWQRYVMPLLPVMCWWAGYAAAELGEALVMGGGKRERRDAKARARAG